MTQVIYSVRLDEVLCTSEIMRSSFSSIIFRGAGKRIKAPRDTARGKWIFFFYITTLTTNLTLVPMKYISDEIVF